MLPFAYPVILALLIPVIVIEAIYLRARLKTEWKPTLSATAKANAVTMLLGFPLAWAMFFGVELLLWIGLATTGIGDRLQWAPGHAIAKMVIVATSAAWLGPGDERWVIPFAYAILLVPSFILSGFVESRLIRRNDLLGRDPSCSRAVWQANVLSYIFLAIVGCMTLWGFMNWSGL